MVHIRRPIDLVSHSDGKRYTSLREYEKSLEDRGQYIMSDREFRETREKLLDEAHSQPKKRETHNHVHIDIANDRIEKSTRDLKTDE
jgi:hypothetical protein